MRTMWRGLIGRHWYRVDVSATDRWALIREHPDPRDDDTVAQGWTWQQTHAQLMAEVADELHAIAEGLTDEGT